MARLRVRRQWLCSCCKRQHSGGCAQAGLRRGSSSQNSGSALQCGAMGSVGAWGGGGQLSARVGAAAAALQLQCCSRGRSFASGAQCCGAAGAMVSAGPRTPTRYPLPACLLMRDQRCVSTTESVPRGRPLCQCSCHTLACCLFSVCGYCVGWLVRPGMRFVSIDHNERIPRLGAAQAGA